MAQRHVGLITFVTAVAWLSACTTAPLPPSQRPANWAQPIARDGLPNLHQVSDALYRGAQPTRAGAQQLAPMGIRTVINARQSDTDRDWYPGGIQYVRLPMSAWNVSDAEVISFLRVVTDDSATPVFVHCHRGADRCGVLCAMYRIAVQGWSKEQAIAEMTRGGMGFHGVYTNLISYIRSVDVAWIRREAGIPDRQARSAATQPG